MKQTEFEKLVAVRRKRREFSTWAYSRYWKLVNDGGCGLVVQQQRSYQNSTMFPPADRLWQEFSETASPRCEEAVIGHCGTSGPGCHDVKHRDVGEIRKKRLTEVWSHSCQTALQRA